MSKLGDKIKEIRINEGLSQEAFAKELGYTSFILISFIFSPSLLIVCNF